MGGNGEGRCFLWDSRILMGYKKLWPRMIFQESEQGEILTHETNGGSFENVNERKYRAVLVQMLHRY